jgi:hypothetical protein
MLPPGIKHLFWIVAIGKFSLETGHLSADESLGVLKSIHSITDECGYFNKQVLAMVQPASRAVYEIFDAAMKLGHNEVFKVLTCRETFDILLKLNPSVLEAIEYADARWNCSAVKIDANGVPTPAVAAPSVANSYYEMKPDPRGSHLDDSFFEPHADRNTPREARTIPAGPTTYLEVLRCQMILQTPLSIPKGKRPCGTLACLTAGPRPFQQRHTHISPIGRCSNLRFCPQLFRRGKARTVLVLNPGRRRDLSCGKRGSEFLLVKRHRTHEEAAKP